MVIAYLLSTSEHGKVKEAFLSRFAVPRPHPLVRMRMPCSGCRDNTLIIRSYVGVMAFFNLTQLGPQNLFSAASNLPDDPAASKFSSSGIEQKPVGMGSSGALPDCCSKVMECAPPSREALIDTTGDQTVPLYTTDKVGKSTETTSSTSKGRAEFKVKLLMTQNFIP